MALPEEALPKRTILRWDPYLEPDEGDMEFRLTYEGQLLAHRDDHRLERRSLHVHDIRKKFHLQLKELWRVHPVLTKTSEAYMGLAAGHEPIFDREGFKWKPIATEANGLICRLEVLLLRAGRPGNVLFDIDNRMKTLFDALRMAKNPDELGASTPAGKRKPEPDENPFYVLLEDDKIITHLALTTDRLLEPVPNTPLDDAVRIVISVTIRPYDVHMENVAFT